MNRPLSLLVLGALLLPVAVHAAPRRPETLPDFQARVRSKLMRLDTNRDGRISLAEFSARPQRARPDGRQRDPQRAFARYDLNHDGFIEPAEIDAVSARRFGRMDLNHDGTVTPAERDERRGQRGVR